MKTTFEIDEVLERELLSWPDVTAGPHDPLPGDRFDLNFRPTLNQQEFP